MWALEPEYLGSNHSCLLLVVWLCVIYLTSLHLSVPFFEMMIIIVPTSRIIGRVRWAWKPIEGRCHSHLTDKEAETQRSDVPYPRLHSWWAELGFEPRLSLYVSKAGETGIIPPSSEISASRRQSPEIFYFYTLKKMLHKESAFAPSSQWAHTIIQVSESLQRALSSFQHFPLSKQCWEVCAWVLFGQGIGSKLFLIQTFLLSQHFMGEGH